MTYDEARVAITMLLVAKGEPAPDFSDDLVYSDREDKAGIGLFYLANSIKDALYYEGPDMIIPSSIKIRVQEAIEALTGETE